MQYSTTNSGLPNDIVSSIVQDGCSNYWIGTTDGLALFNGDTWTVYNTKNSGIPGNYVYSLALDTARGGIWVGSLDSGLAYFDEASSWTVYDTGSGKKSIPNLSISDIKIDAAGNVWIATYYGIAVFNGKTWTSYTVDNSGLATTDCRAIYIDKNNIKWIGTANGGMYKFDGTTFTQYNTSNSGIGSNDIYSITADDGGNLWYASQTKGIGTYNGTTFTNYYVADSASDADLNRVTKIVIDSANNKWLTTYHGLVEYSSNGIWTIFNSANSPILAPAFTWGLYIDNSTGDKWVGTIACGGLYVYNEQGYISGPCEVASGQQGVRYYVSSAGSGATYNWSVPPGAQISGTATDTSILVNYGSSSGVVALTEQVNGTTYILTKYITVDNATTAITSASSSAYGLSAYPNPFANEASLQITTDITYPVQLTISDLTGSEVFSSGNYSTNQNITIGSNLHPGVYIVKAAYNNQSSYSKIVKSE